MLANDIPEIKHSFLAKSDNAPYREIIFKNKFKYDLQISYAEYGRFLSIYERDIDIISTDLIIEGSGFLHRVQLKSIFENFEDLPSLNRYESPTKSWDVSSILVKPELEKIDLMVEGNQYDIQFESLEPEYVPLGYGGSVILQRIHYDTEDKVDVRYSIFNSTILYLAASEKYNTNFFGEKNSESKRAEVKKMFKKVVESQNKTVKINRSWFVDLDYDNLRVIGAMGIPTPESPYGLWFYLTQFNKDQSIECYYRLQTVFTNENILNIRD